MSPRLERTLFGLENSGYSQLPELGEMGIISTSIDENRIKKLSQLAEKINQSMWVDLFKVIIAIVIGAAIGMVVINSVLKTSMFGTKSLYNIQEEDKN